MPEEIIVSHCAPTLAGLKTANLMTCPFACTGELVAFIRQWNTRLKDRGVRFLPLKYADHKALVYVYRPKFLAGDLQNELAKRLLRERGYGCASMEQCIAELIRRLAKSREFPHEIGLFLGYPPEDVNGFIENKPQSCKCVGCWKVYGDERAARRTFRKFKKCTEVYRAQYRQGKPVERLTVAM